MKKIISLTILIGLSCNLLFAQKTNEIVDDTLGNRIIRNGIDYLVFSDNGLQPDTSDYRKINYKVYFRKVARPTFEIDRKIYQLITVPSSSKKLNQETEKKDLLTNEENSRVGKIINKKDFDSNFWIEEEVIKKYSKPEFYKFANDVFSGLLTAPFKYRLQRGNAVEALIDGDFNIAPFIGWKWRVSSSNPYYLAPFIFSGVTTLNYNSANNNKIDDADISENGVGLTYGLGISFKFGDVSPGFIVGWDKGFGNLGSGFIYNDKPWISFSVNYDFFKPSQTTAMKQK